jgi:hypothetical protein
MFKGSVLRCSIVSLARASTVFLAIRDHSCPAPAYPTCWRHSSLNSVSCWFHFLMARLQQFDGGSKSQCQRLSLQLTSIYWCSGSLEGNKCVLQPRNKHTHMFLFSVRMNFQVKTSGLTPMYRFRECFAHTYIRINAPENTCETYCGNIIITMNHDESRVLGKTVLTTGDIKLNCCRSWRWNSGHILRLGTWI